MLLTLHSAGAGFEAACHIPALPEGHRSRRLHGHSYFAQARCAEAYQSLHQGAWFCAKPRV